jgi:UDPglucose--hexose-1-phosphate uridylyltransferase
MPQLRRDPIVGRWVIVNTEEPAGPDDFEKEAHRWSAKTCPFCYGNESMTPPEIEAVREEGTAPNTPGWQVRVVPNKFPALRIEGDLDKRGLGMYDMSNGLGAHEVIIETPYHNKTLGDLLPGEIENVIRTYRSRSLDLRKDRRFKYILIFKNHGPSAGASLEHPHTQLIALPMVPKNVKEELNGSHIYHEYRERCIFCDIIRQEDTQRERVVEENDHFLCFCPFVSRFAFESWVMPKRHCADFGKIRDEEIPSLADVLKKILTKMETLLSNPSYNFIIHTSPFDGDELEWYHWHIEIMPHLMRVAGFESGSGFYIVPTSPEVAARYYREVK